MAYILLVEDNDLDARLTQEVFEEFGAHIELVRMQDGSAAWRYLEQQVTAGEGKLPSCILLDMNMTPADGLWLLQRMKSHSTLSDVKVMVMSERGEKVELARDFHNVFGAVTKPKSVEEYRELLRAITRLVGALRAPAH